MSLKNVFNRIKREIGIKHCIIIEGNVGDIYLDEKGQILDLKEYLKNILDEMDYDNVICWDKVEGTKDDISGLELVDNIEVQGETYIDDDISEIVEQKIDTREVKNMFSIIMKNLLNKNKRIAFVLNWADFLFSGSQLSTEEREEIIILGKAIRESIPEYKSQKSEEVNESTVILITNKLSMFPISFYQSNPEVSIVTLPKPDREEREDILRKISPYFNVNVEKGKELIDCDKINEYIDMLNDFTNREIIQLTKLSQKEEKMSFD